MKTNNLSPWSSRGVCITMDNPDTNIDRLMRINNLDEDILAERLDGGQLKGLLPKELIRKVAFPRPQKRRELKYLRQQLKDAASDKHRSLDTQPELVDVAALAKKLKNKSDIELSDLKTLKNILLDNEKNTNIVLSHEGALRGIVRELTGSDVRRQEQAAGILCNLALSQAETVLLLAKVTSVYLALTLDTLNEPLAVVTAWTVGNMFGAGAPVCRVLEGAGAGPPLCRLARRGRDAAEAALYALSLYASEMRDEMSIDRLKQIIESTAKVRCKGVFRLYFILSCHRDFVDEGLLETAIIDCIEDLMIAHRACAATPDCCDLLYAIRTLASLSAEAYCRLLTHINQNTERRQLFYSLNEDGRLQASMLWFYGNVLQKQQLFAEDMERTNQPGDQSMEPEPN